MWIVATERIERGAEIRINYDGGETDVDPSAPRAHPVTAILTLSALVLTLSPSPWRRRDARLLEGRGTA